MVTLDQLNWEASLFLKHLAAYKSTAKDVCYATHAILSKIQADVDAFLDQIKVNYDMKAHNPFQIDETHFEARHLIMCRLCHFPIGPTKDEYIAHLTSEHHNTLVADFINRKQKTVRLHDDVATPVPDMRLAIDSGRDDGQMHARRELWRAKGPAAQPRRASISSHDDDVASIRSARPDGYGVVYGGYYDGPMAMNNKQGNWRDHGPPGFRQRSASNASRDGHGNRPLNRRNSIDHDPRQPVSNGNNNGNQRMSRQMECGPSAAAPQSAPKSAPMPNVFDDNIYDYIDLQNNQTQRHANSQPVAAVKPPSINNINNNVDIPNNNNPSDTTPPYMLNSLFTNRLNQGSYKAPMKKPSPPPVKRVITPPVKSAITPRPTSNKENFTVTDGCAIKPVPSYALDMLKQQKGKPQNTMKSTGHGTNKYSSQPDPKRKIAEVLSALRSRSVSNCSDEISANGASEATPTASIDGASNTNSESQPKAELFEVSMSMARQAIDRRLEEGTRLRNLPVYTEITGHIEELLQTKCNYTNVKCHLFGSRMLGVATDDSELDIFVDILKSFDEARGADALSLAADKVENAMRNSSMWSDVRVVAERPMIRLHAQHKSSQIHCNIAFGIHGTGVTVHTSRLIQYLFDAYENCRRMVIWMENWFSTAPNINFNGYLITLLVIFHFQMRKKIPSIKSMQEGIRQKCGENLVGFKRFDRRPTDDDNLVDLISDFYLFYSKFDFSENIISVYEGTCIKHTICDKEMRDLSPQTNRFRSFLVESPNVWNNKKLCVQDIFVHRNNVGVSVRMQQILNFKIYCRDSIKISQKTLQASAQRDLELSKSNETLFKEFFLRDIIPVLSFQMSEGVSLREQPIYAVITDDIVSALRTKFPGVECHLYGSRLLGTANLDSHLDIYVDLLSSFSTSRTAIAIKLAADTAEKLLRANTTWSSVKVITQRPMIRLLAMHAASKIPCNIAFGIQGTGAIVYTSRLIRSLFDLQDVCRQTVIWITSWFRTLPSEQMRNFNGYLITLLVIFYFQTKKKLPSVEELQEQGNAVRCGENYVGYTVPQAYPVWSERFRQILAGFFEFYAYFKFSENIVSVFEGAPISFNLRYEDDEKLGSTRRRFKSFMIVHETEWNTRKMCVQDIFVHKNNVAEAISLAELEHFQKYCKQSMCVLQSPDAATLRY